MAEKIRPVVAMHAACACGAVTIAVDGPIYAMFMCACLDCQRASGAGHSAVAVTDPKHVVVTGVVADFAREAASGATFTRHFCPTCGTPLYGRSSRAPDSIMLPVGFFTGQNDWFVPNQLIFARSHRDWDVVADYLPLHETYRTKGEA